MAAIAHETKHAFTTFTVEKRPAAKAAHYLRRSPGKKDPAHERVRPTLP